jgi:hypothetical protein
MTYFDLYFKVMLSKEFSVKNDFFFFLEVDVLARLTPGQTARNLE